MTPHSSLALLASLFRPQIRIALAPHAVGILQGKRWRQTNVSVRTLPDDEQAHEQPHAQTGSASSQSWQAALETLAPQLQGLPAHSPVDIVLSHHFCGVHLLDAPGIALSHAETRAWIAEQLARRLGRQAHTWHIAWQPSPQGEALLVASMAPEALAALQNTLLQHRLQPRQVRPWLAACCDTHWARLRRGHVFLALSEPGMMCLASLAHGQFRFVRCSRGDTAPAETLTALLARECLLHPTPADARHRAVSTTPEPLPAAWQSLWGHPLWVRPFWVRPFLRPQILGPRRQEHHTPDTSPDVTDLRAMLDIPHAPR